MPKRKVKPPERILVNLLRPRTIDATMELARALAEGKTPTTTLFNKGLMSRAAIEAEIRAFNDVVDANGEIDDESKHRTPPSTTPIYQPAMVDGAIGAGAEFGFAGQPSKQPKRPNDWDDKVLGEWRKPTGTEGEEDYDPGSLGCKVGAFRKCHNPDVRKQVVDPGENILTIGAHEYVIGAKDTPAVFLANAHKSGTYGAANQCGKRLSLEGVKGVDNCVAQIGNQIEVIHCDDGTDPGASMVVLPNMILRWGYIEQGGKRLTNLQIRKAVANGDKGLKFIELTEPIVGKGFSRSQLWQAVKRAMSLVATKRGDDDATALDRYEARAPRSGKERADSKDGVWRNAGVMTRVDPSNLFGFGIRSNLMGCPPRMYYGETLDEHLCRYVLGARTATAFAENRWDAKARLGVVEERAEKPAAKKPAKAKAEKPKGKKAKKGKGKKGKAPAQVDAPPVEEVEPVTTDPELAEEEELDAAQREAAEADAVAATDD